MEPVGVGVLTVGVCLAGVLGLAALVGVGLVLLKLGVIGSYWLKGDEPGDETGDYHLDQSHGA